MIRLMQEVYSIARPLALKAIAGYQTHISPDRQSTMADRQQSTLP